MRYHLIRENRGGDLSLVHCYGNKEEADRSKHELDKVKGDDEYWVKEVKVCTHED